ncbi:FAD-dependent oxidoreductase [Kushneria phosphatilytica]|uniref:FAD/NAD(P)-binding protein n=1 Tax=Kushneria phosphatilytica TaxID=657387 RepID=A0A1S1NMZ6_9GAMM|nr:FAD/NAD(P)-binding protein [Kushneria phosphatilytica]OHV08687.1 hypothetical protein BH688_11670 [Kushneria phosphatilytica]QEL12405.1 FAD/NAD(P)-binding protein [Kushneria phosphatilytica]
MPDYMRRWFPQAGLLSPAGLEFHSIAGASFRPANDDPLSPTSSATAPAGQRIHTAIIIGGGPAGTALLIAASKQKKLCELARAGLVMVEREAAIGGGRLGQYAITSDTTAATFLSAVKDNPYPELAALIDHPTARQIAHHDDTMGVPLAQVGPFLRECGQRLHRIVEDHGGDVLTGHEAIDARQRSDGLWCVRLRRVADGSERTLLSRSVVIATGGHQPLERLTHERFAGDQLMARAGNRLMQSDEVIELGGVERVRERLRDCRSPRIAVLGGSTSAMSAANLLLRATPALPLADNGITLLHRRPLRPFYPSVEAAHADGFTDFTHSDICPVSGFVYRLGGLRLESRELLLRMMGINGRQPDSRLHLYKMNNAHDPGALDILDQADLIITAFGYRPHALPLFCPLGSAIELAAQGPGRPAMVNRQCQVLDSTGQSIHNLFGIGLAAGFVPSGALGGEPSFSGQANGLWLWQNDVGMIIVDSLMRLSTSHLESNPLSHQHAIEAS